jgi:hypothetical protein
MMWMIDQVPMLKDRMMKEVKADVEKLLCNHYSWPCKRANYETERGRLFRKLEEHLPSTLPPLDEILMLINTGNDVFDKIHIMSTEPRTESTSSDELEDVQQIDEQTPVALEESGRARYMHDRPLATNGARAADIRRMTHKKSRELNLLRKRLVVLRRRLSPVMSGLRLTLAIDQFINDQT